MLSAYRPRPLVSSFWILVQFLQYSFNFSPTSLQPAQPELTNPYVQSTFAQFARNKCILFRSRMKSRHTEFIWRWWVWSRQSCNMRQKIKYAWLGQYGIYVLSITTPSPIHVSLSPGYSGFSFKSFTKIYMGKVPPEDYSGPSFKLLGIASGWCREEAKVSHFPEFIFGHLQWSYNSSKLWCLTLLIKRKINQSMEGKGPLDMRRQVKFYFMNVRHIEYACLYSIFDASLAADRRSWLSAQLVPLHPPQRHPQRGLHHQVGQLEARRNGVYRWVNEGERTSKEMG